MKKSALKFLKFMMVAMIVSATIISCDDDDNDGPELTGDSKLYTLNSVSSPSISGTVKFSERSDNSTLVTIDLNGTTAGNTHPAHFHSNSAIETGDIIIELNPVDGATGISETVVRRKKDGSSVTYQDLLELDAYINVHQSAADLNTLIAQGDVGVNELTNTSTTYDLGAVNASGITGTVTFAKRVSGNTLVTVDLNGAGTSGEYPVYIYDNSIAAGGPIAIDLTTVNGATGVSYTHVAELNSGTAITYDQLTTFNGHILVSASPATPTVYVAQTNIGSND